MNQKKTALITGANKGIGLETARQLGKKDVTVLVGARDVSKGKAAADGIGQGRNRRAFRRDRRERSGERQKSGGAGRKGIRPARHPGEQRGVMKDDTEKKVSEQSLDTWRETFDTNVLGLIETTNAFLPLLRKSEAGRIVNLSSILGSIEFHATPGSPVYENKDAPAYNVSKSAVNAYTVQLAYELKETKLKVNAAHPGWVKTEMGGEGAMMEIVDGAKTSVALATIGEDGPNGVFVHMGEPLPW